MSPRDSRLTLALGDLAGEALEGVQSARRYLAPEPLQTACAVAALRREPDRGAEQLDQLLFGERFDGLERRGDWAFGQALRDGYVGWVELAALGPAGGEAPTHWISALRTYGFGEPSIKAAPVAQLCMNALVRVAGREGRFAHIEGAGFVVEGHLRPLGDWRDDPAAVAQGYLGAPYLWGGRCSLGLDCSGLVQQALYACGRGCPRDSDQQAGLGSSLDPAEPMQRGDLVFWPGHVGMMLDAETLLHANAFHMAVAAEPLDAAVARVGEPAARRRLRA